MNYNGGTPGEDLTNLNGLTLATYNLTAGEQILLRFYPSLTLASMPSAPTLATTYGQVRSSTVESSLGDGSETAWVVPASGTVDFNYITVNDPGAGGTYSNASADATNFVGPGLGVPEPSTYALMGCAASCLIGLRLRNKAAGAVA